MKCRLTQVHKLSAKDPKTNKQFFQHKLTFSFSFLTGYQELVIPVDNPDDYELGADYEFKLEKL